MLIAACIGTVLGVLSVLHVYWGIRGVSARSIALPEVNGSPAFVPSRASCFAVAGGLALAAALVLWRGRVFPSHPVPEWLVTAGALGVGCVFVLRAVGDFRLVGFFKRVRGSAFARWDTRLFSPLCLCLGIGSLWVALS